MTPAEQFDKLGDDTILAAEAIRCPPSEFVSGLAGIISALQDRLAIAHAEYGNDPE